MLSVDLIFQSLWFISWSPWRLLLAEIWLNVALNTINRPIYFVINSCCITINSINLHICFHIRWCSCRLTVTRRVSYVEHELLSLSKHLSSAPVFSGACVARSVLCSVFVFCSFVLSVIPVQITAMVSSNSSSLEAMNDWIQKCTSSGLNHWSS